MTTTVTMTTPPTTHMMREVDNQPTTTHDEQNSTNAYVTPRQQQATYQRPQPGNSTGRPTHTTLGAIAVNWK